MTEETSTVPATEKSNPVLVALLIAVWVALFVAAFWYMQSSNAPWVLSYWEWCQNVVIHAGDDEINPLAAQGSRQIAGLMMFGMNIMSYVIVASVGTWLFSLLFRKRRE